MICIAVKEDSHQNVVSSGALMRGVEEPWTIEREWLNSSTCLDIAEIILKSDTDPAIGVRSEIVWPNHAKHRTGSSRTHWCCHAESSEPSNVTLKAAHKNHSVTNHQSCAVQVSERSRRDKLTGCVQETVRECVGKQIWRTP